MEILREYYLNKIRPYYEIDLIKVLTGVRRSGKSILLSQIRDEFIANGIDKEHIIEINFEDLSFENIKTYKKLNTYILKNIKDEQKYYIFLDEIQHVNGFEKVLSSLRATQNCSIFITGSNSKLLSGKLATLLVGRCIEFRILPFSFKEAFDYLTMLGKNPNPDSLIIDYISWGGLPLRFSFDQENDIKNYLEQTYNGIVDKDIVTEKSKFNKEKFLRFAS